MSSFGVVIDACVLIKASVRDTLIRAYGAGLYRLHWTEDILAEVEMNLVQNGLTSSEGAERLARTFRDVLAEAQVADYEGLIETMTNHPKDRHILAAAVAAGAQFIVTENLRDFPDRSTGKYGIEARSPDEFLGGLFVSNRETLAAIISKQAAALSRPALTTEQVLDNLARDGVPTFVRMIRQYLSSANPQDSL